MVSGGRSRPPFGARAKDSMARSMSAAVSIGLGTSSIASDGADGLGRPQEVIIGGRVLGLPHKRGARQARRDLLEHRQPLAGDARLVHAAGP